LKFNTIEKKLLHDIYASMAQDKTQMVNGDEANVMGQILRKTDPKSMESFDTIELKSIKFVSQQIIDGMSNKEKHEAITNLLPVLHKVIEKAGKIAR